MTNLLSSGQPLIAGVFMTSCWFLRLYSLGQGCGSDSAPLRVRSRGGRGGGMPRPQSPENMGESKKSNNRHSTDPVRGLPSASPDQHPSNVSERASGEPALGPYLAPRSPLPPPESAALCSAAGGQTISSPVRTLQTQGALPEAKGKLKGQRLSPPTPL